MKKVLFIAYLYPPIANSGTQRSLKFANYLPDYGWEPIVLTVAEPPARDCDNSLLKEVRPGTRIERVHLWSDVIGRKIANVFQIMDSERLAAGLSWRIGSLWQVPDICAFWWPTAVRRAEEIFHREGFDAIYASGWPWTSFLIAREISRRTRRPYVLDYRDLWQPMGAQWDSESLMQKWMRPRLERPALLGASAIITTTPSFVRMLETSAVNRKVVCITNGFDPDEFTPRQEFPHSARDTWIQIVYTGVWRPGYSPEDLYLAVRKLKENTSPAIQKLKVVVAGFPIGPAKKYGIEDIIEELGPVSHSCAINLMVHATVLFLPVSEGFYAKGSLPGKLFEYIGSGRPIIAAVPPDSEVAAILASVGGALCVAPGDIQDLMNSIERLCGDNGTDVFTARRAHVVARYTRSSVTKELAAVLSSVAKNEN